MIASVRKIALASVMISASFGVDAAEDVIRFATEASALVLRQAPTAYDKATAGSAFRTVSAVLTKAATRGITTASS